MKIALINLVCVEFVSFLVSFFSLNLAGIIITPVPFIFLPKSFKICVGIFLVIGYINVIVAPKYIVISHQMFFLFQESDPNIHLVHISFRVYSLIIARRLKEYKLISQRPPNLMRKISKKYQKKQFYACRSVFGKIYFVFTVPLLNFSCSE